MNPKHISLHHLNIHALSLSSGQMMQQQQQRGGLSANSSLDHSGYMSDRNELGFHHHQQPPSQQQQRVIMNGGYIPNRNMR